MRSVFSLNRVKQNWNMHNKIHWGFECISIHKMLIAHFSIYYKLPDKIRSRHQKDISWFAFNIQPILFFFLLRKKLLWFNFGHKIVANCYGFMWTVNTFEPKYIWMPSQWRLNLSPFRLILCEFSPQKNLKRKTDKKSLLNMIPNS